jgi:hypothetical protein
MPCLLGLLHRNLRVLSCDLLKRTAGPGFCPSTGRPSVGAPDDTSRWGVRLFAVHSNRRAGFKASRPLLVVKEDGENGSPEFGATIEDTDVLNRYGEITQILHLDAKLKIRRSRPKWDGVLWRDPQFQARPVKRKPCVQNAEDSAENCNCERNTLNKTGANGGTRVSLRPLQSSTALGCFIASLG